MQTSHVDKTMTHVDWQLLAEQKLALLEVLSACRYSADPQPLAGLLHFIDALQDAAEKDGHRVVWLTDDNNEETR